MTGKTLDQLLRIMIGQKIGLPHLIPLAVALLETRVWRPERTSRPETA